MGLFNKIIDKMVSDKVPFKKRKRLIVFVAIITLLSMTTATVAWFTVNTFAGVDKLDLNISLAAQLKVSMENHGKDLEKYGKVITNEMIDDYLKKHGSSLEDTVLDPVTTREGTEFTNQRGTVREPNKHSYLEFECYFIATEEMWVHLTTESTKAGADDGTKVSTESTGAKADVVNCARVDFTAEGTGNGTTIYEPNRSTPVNGQTTFDLPSGSMVYSNNTRLFHLNQLEPVKVTVRLWIEGNDPECDDDVQDAQLSVQLGFIGCDKDNKPIS